MVTEEELRQRYTRLLPHLNERNRRLVLGADALEEGYGGISKVARAAGVCRNTVRAGIADLAAGACVDDGAVRRPGGGRKPVEVTQAGIDATLEALIEPVTRGDPDSPLRWTSKSCMKLMTELRSQGFRVSHETVRRLLYALDYSLQAPVKVLEGGDHPDRDAQFAHIHDTVQALQAAGVPVISVDGKKKELIGDYKNGGREWQPATLPVEVNVYDYPDDADGKALPYGVYDLTANEGWVSVGMDHDTAAFAVATIRRWWEQMGHARYPDAAHLLICADGGGSNGSRCRLWKRELQTWADDLGLAISVCHLPPGTSKWNKIEHRLFSFISINWRGKPLTSYAIMVQLIQQTTTATGLRVQAALDPGSYPTGVVVSEEELADIDLLRDNFHGEWNYTILPRTRRGR
jgi:hypothetical protein